MNQYYKELQDIMEATQEATNETKLSEKAQSFLALQRQIFFEAYLDLEEITPHPTVVKLPFSKRKIVILDLEEWEDFYGYSQDNISNFVQAQKELDYCREALDKLGAHATFEDYIKKELKDWDIAQFEKVLEHEQTFTDKEWNDIVR